MNFIRLLPVFFSILLLSAHAFRAGILMLVFIILASPFILLIRKPWAVRLIQTELILGGIEWIRTMINLVHIRQMHGMPWLRLAVILGIVVLITFFSACVFRLRTLRERYDPEKQSIT